MKEIKAFVRKERLNEVVKIEIASNDENVEKSLRF
jgi:nitrogen regulatory protein PII